MSKKLGLFLCMVLLIVFMNTTAFASVTSFNKGYGFDYGIGNISADQKGKMSERFSDLVGTTIDGSVVGANDWVVLKNVDNNSYNNLLNYFNGVSNVYFWKEESDGTIRKVYGGSGTYNGFIGYAIHRDNLTYALADSNQTTPRIYCRTTDFLNTGKGGPVCIRPGTINPKVTYGKYDLNLSGITEFTIKFAINAVNGNMPVFDAYLTQGEDAYLEKEPTSEYNFKQVQIFDIQRGGDIRYYGSGSVAGRLTTNLGWNSADKYYTATITVDTLSEQPKYKIKIAQNNGTVIANGAWENIPEGRFDFTKDMGIKLVLQEYMNQTSEIHLGVFSMSKTVNIDDNTYTTKATIVNQSGYAKSGLFIAALYDTAANKLVNLKTITVENLADEDNLEIPITIDGLNELTDVSQFKVKYFFWSDMDEMLEPYGIQDTSNLLPTIVCE